MSRGAKESYPAINSGSILCPQNILFFFSCGSYFLFNLHSVFVKFIYKQITSLFTVHEHRDSTVFVM